MTRRRLPTRPRAAACAAAGALVAATLSASVSTALPAAAAPVLQAVAAYEGAVPSVAGVEVVRVLPALHLAVVRGNAAAMVRLAGTRGIRGLAPDDAVQLASRPDSGTDGVLASTGLGGAAGRPGAGAGVRVAVVDTGVSDTAALSRASGRLVDAVDTSGPAGDSDRADGNESHHRSSSLPRRVDGPLVDGYGHGTFMADVIAGGPVAATHGRALGVAPAATVLVVRVARTDGSTSLSRVLAGLDWVAGHAQQVDVASLSFSHTRPHSAYGADPLTDAVESVRAAGVTVIVAAGNEHNTLGDPGFDPRVLTVGAADLPARRTAPFSGSGRVAGVSKPDVLASGVSVLGLLPPTSVLARTKGTAHLPGGLYRGSGTSQATAVTSGVAALLLESHPEATPAQVKASLRCAAVDLHGHRDGAGLVQATTTLCSAPDGSALDGSGNDLTGEGSFDASSWAASSWAASSWAASSWAASSWAASSWAASSWASAGWGGGS